VIVTVLAERASAFSQGQTVGLSSQSGNAEIVLGQRETLFAANASVCGVAEVAVSNAAFNS